MIPETGAFVPLRKLRKQSRPETQAAGSSQAQTELDRPTADEIYEQVSRNARHELDRSVVGLTISGLAGGITMGLTALSTSIVIAQLGPTPAARFVADLFRREGGPPSTRRGPGCDPRRVG